MLRENEDGSIEIYFADIEEKKLIDTHRKMKRRLSQMPVNDLSKKSDLQARQKTTRYLRMVKQKINERSAVNE